MTAPTLTPRQIRELERRLFGPRENWPVLDRLFGWGARVFIVRDRLAVVR